MAYLSSNSPPSSSKFGLRTRAAPTTPQMNLDTEIANQIILWNGPPTDQSRLRVPTRADLIRDVRQTIANMSPLEVAIVYDNGQSVQTINRYFICDVSHFFKNAFGGNFKESHTRVLRLRDDFPWAVFAMLRFLKTGSYYMYSRLLEQIPHFTMFDLHVHCYIMGDKYDILALADYAAKTYLRMAADVLALEWDRDDPDFYDAEEAVPYVDYHYTDMYSAAEVKRFLDSITLLWRNTAGSRDPLRVQVLEVIKPAFAQLMRLKSFHYVLVYLDDFVLDLAASLAEDGLRVVVKPEKQEGRIDFG